MKNDLPIDIGSGWNPRIASAVADLVARYGKNSAAYDASRKPVAVFDFDDTLVFGDFGEAALRRQINRFALAMTPEQFAAHMPISPNGVERLPENHGGARIEDISRDLAEHYEYLCTHRSSGEPLPLATHHSPLATHHSPLATPHSPLATLTFLDFEVKLNLLFDAMIDAPGLGKAFVYPWSNRLQEGMTQEALRALARECWPEVLAQPIGIETLESPPGLHTRAGPQRISYATGIREVPEMKALLRLLASEGFDSYIVTASHQDVIRAIVGDPASGYDVPEDHVLGMRLEIENGRYTDALDRAGGYDVTYGPGKVKVIDAVIGRAPVLVAGDSDTDFEMLTAYPETRLRILIDRKKAGAMLSLYNKCARGEDGFLLQKRDGRAGAFSPET